MTSYPSPHFSMLKKVNLYDLSFPELESLVVNLGEPSYRALQIWQWLYQKYFDNVAEMSNLPKVFRETLLSRIEISAITPVVKQNSSDNQTEKVLLKLVDGLLIETVLMRYDRRLTLCISSQVGCAMGCVFCATGQMGFGRNLNVGEIVGQVLYFARRLRTKGERVTNIVLMGMGEPLHNYDNIMAALDILTNSDGFNLGARRITISSVGLVPAIRRFADEQRQSSLAISLHAASDEERNKIIPLNKRWPLHKLMEACRYYISKTGRRLTFEWALIDGRNDSENDARELGELLEGMLCHVNLIPLNPTDGFSGRPSSRKRVGAFQKELTRLGIGSTVRVRRGIDIQAGCGQLRDRVLREGLS